ncbi:MAG: STAS domain-containing protein [Gammaproteobacteria bacterium]|nr:STAS domain-containing protein [Gammaproteobacteria bacterium]
MIAFLEARRAGLFHREHILPNLLAGITVGIVALPLAMAFAIASGARPEQGIYTAIFAGILVSLFGGSRVQIAGPTGAFIVILFGISAKYGIDGLQIATLMAGVILVVMGMAKLGGIIKFIPSPVVVGFTSGIAVIIWVGQWKEFFGLHPVEFGNHFHQKVWHLIGAFPTLHPATTGLALTGLLLVIFSPKYLKRIPGPLVAMLVVTALQVIFQFKGVETIGSAFGGIPQGLPEFKMPEISFTRIVELIGPALTIAMLGAIESLLSAVVADGMTGVKHNSNQELIGQGVANMVTPLFGGFAATGAIARTASNIKNGGNSPLAGIAHAVTLLLILLVLAPYAAHIPLCALAAILFVVAYNMSEMRHFLGLVRGGPRNDVIVLLITFVLTVFADLVVAVNVGVILAALLFMKRMSESVRIEDITAGEIEAALPEGAQGELPQGVRIYSIDGPFFFGAAETFERTLAGLHEDVKVLIIRLGRVPFIDATAMHTFGEMIKLFQKRRTRIVICEANERVIHKLTQAHIIERLGEGNVYPDLVSALDAVRDSGV